MSEIWVREFGFAVQELDFRGRVHPVSLLHHFQEAAGAHAALLGVGVRELHARNLTWVLSRYRLRFFGPIPGDGRATVTTWPSTRSSLAAFREFELRAEGGRLLAGATSSWLLLSLENRRPVKLETHLPGFPALSRRAVADDFPPLPRAERSDRQESLRVLRRDLDLNEHANHASFVHWALEAVPEETWRSHYLAEMEIAFRGEALYGDPVCSSLQQVESEDGKTYLHLLSGGRPERELSRARTAWKLG